MLVVAFNGFSRSVLESAEVKSASSNDCGMHWEFIDYSLGSGCIECM